MKQFAALALVGLATPAMADGASLVRFDDPAVFFPAALGKQVDIRFSDTFVAAHLAKADFDGVILSQLPDGQACFFGREQGLDPDDPKLAGVAKGDANDLCVPRGDVAVRVAATPQAGKPAMPFYSTDKALCSWAWKEGKGIGVWTEDCKFDTGRWAVDYSEADDSFALSVDGGDPFPVLRQFHVAAGQGPEGLLPGLKDKGLVLNDAECVFKPSTEQLAPAGWDVWQVVPIGKRKEAFDNNPQDEIPEPPCGDLGYAADSIGFFMTDKDHPDRVLYVNLGQDGTMIDPFTVQLF